MVEKDHQRRLDAVRDSNRRKTLRDSLAWLKQAARTPMEANLQRSGNPASPGGTMQNAHVAWLDTCVSAQCSKAHTGQIACSANVSQCR